MKCFYCNKELTMERGEVWFVPIDRPVYGLIPFHKQTCLVEVDTYGKEKYFLENLDKLSEFLKPHSIEGKVKRGN